MASIKQCYATSGSRLKALNVQKPMGPQVLNASGA